jgi:predicted MFS family arabinose efflux permease
VVSTNEPATEQRSEPDGYAWYVLALLSTTYAFNFIDRNIVSILLQPIKDELGVSDTAMGFLSGFAFAAFYTVMGIPLARWADLGTRRTILALGVAVWSAMTVASGLARGFVQLSLARVGVGVGEAAGTPPAHSLIADYFPPHRRGFALSIYSLGNYLGLAVAYVGGGWINEYYGWRAAFIVVGIPGILLALLVRLTVREPVRGGTDRIRGDASAPTLREVFDFLAGQRSYLWLNLAGAFNAVLGYGFGIWAATFLIRVHGMDTAEVGRWIGLLAATCGAAGTLLGGALSDRLGRRDRRWMLWVPALSCLMNVPINLAFVLGSKAVAIAFFGPHVLIQALFIAPMFASMQGVARPRMRAMAVAIHLFVTNLIGLGLGPLAVGMLNDGLAARYGELAIRYSLVAVTMMGLVAGFLFLVASRTLRADLERASAEAVTGADGSRG